MDVLESRHDEELINKCRNLMNQLYDNTRDLLKTNLDKLGRIAEELLERESLNGKDIERICA
ncbi:hypothetical protein [Clostridium sp. Marseille-P2415]|nr:hypothetical protein [Clostridium sp. Marseille-P2415]